MRIAGRKKIGAAAVALLAGAGNSWAEVPQVATDIAPVHGLVARVMQGLGEPALIVPPGASPHGYSLRPSQARALDQADLVFWLGTPLTPWLAGPLEELATDAHRVELLKTAGTTVLPFREGARFEAHDHDEHDDEHGEKDHGDHEDHGHGDDHSDHAGQDHGHDDHDGHGHDDHGHTDHDHADHGDDGHDNEEHADHRHDDHDHAEHEHDDHGHAHHGDDPHAWLLPSNAYAWLDVIAAELSEVDPENAATYRANADAGKQEIAAAVETVTQQLDAFRDRQFIVFHDAYQYFEQGFDLSAAGAISLSDATKPSPARLAEVRDVVAELDVSCVFSEPQFNPGLVATVLDGTGAGTAVLDPLGAGLEPGPQFYPALLSQLGTAIAGCK